jgi:hypothetical protein
VVRHTVLAGDVVDEVIGPEGALRAGTTWCTAADTSQKLIEHDLVDALHVEVWPIVVGAGEDLFSETSATRRCARPSTSGERIFTLDVHGLRRTRSLYGAGTPGSLPEAAYKPRVAVGSRSSPTPSADRHLMRSGTTVNRLERKRTPAGRLRR